MTSSERASALQAAAAKGLRSFPSLSDEERRHKPSLLWGMTVVILSIGAVVTMGYALAMAIGF